MFVGCDHEVRCSISLWNVNIPQLTDYRNLGMILDPSLKFTLSVDYVVSKVKRASNKIAMLIRDRKGIPIRLGIDMYSSLVRPHLEYTVPVWASLCDSDMLKLEQVQAQCLRKVMGAKRYSSTAALGVITGVIPVRIRMKNYVAGNSSESSTQKTKIACIL